MRKKHIVFVILILVAVIAFSMLSVCGVFEGMFVNHRMLYMHRSSFSLSPTVIIQLAVMISVLVVLTVLLIKTFGKSSTDVNYLDILNRRLANGEISAEEYNEIINTIEKER